MADTTRLLLEVSLLFLLMDVIVADDDDIALTPDGKVDKSYIMSGADQEHQNPTSNWVFFILQPLLWACCCFCAYVQQKRRSALIRTRSTMVERRRRQREAAGEAEEAFDEDARLEEIMTKFDVHEVPPKKTLDDEDSLNKANEMDKESDIEEAEAETMMTISQSLSALWGPSSKAECSICLEGYCSGEKVCLSKNSDCPHVFHQECIAEWLKRHDKCPLCRLDLIT